MSSSADTVSPAECHANTGSSAPSTAPDRDNSAMLADALRLFAARCSDCGEIPAAFPPDAVTATEAMIGVTAILKAVNIQVFELGMWQAFSGQR